MSMLFTLFLVINFTALCSFAETIVWTANGPVRGKVLKSTSGRRFNAFLRIPYAAPPLGDLRFRPPVPHSPWTNVLDCTRDGPVCPQMDSIFNVGNEDCLILNVYTPLPRLKSPSKFLNNGSLPVLVFFHGGAFAIGGATSFVIGPQRFLNKDIVLIAVQYRLGALGFLSTEDSAASGNFGLLDQVLALQWVQQNVGVFGGDPDRVTIFGQSAGGASVIFHMLSKVSRGLFRAGISDSGIALAPSSIQHHPLMFARRLGEALRCPTDRTDVLVRCLRSIPAKTIVAKTRSEFNGYTMLNRVFMPVIENPRTGMFIVEPVESLLRKGKFARVPFLIGVNKHEGILTYKENRTIYDKVDEVFFNVTLPSILRKITKYEKNLDRLAYAIKAEYYDMIDVRNHGQVVRTAIDLNSDCFRKAPVDLTVRHITAGGQPVYMYVFNYAGSCSRDFYDGERMVNHGDELCYLFYMFWGVFRLNSRDQAVADLMVEMWTRFASELNPTPAGSQVHWKPTRTSADGDKIAYLQINSATDVSMQSNYLESRMHFWNVVVPRIVGGKN